MLQYIAPFLLYICLSLSAMAQMPSVGGMWYVPDTQTALLLTWKDGKITKIMHAKGAGKFTKAVLKAQKTDDMGFRFSYSLPTAPQMIYDAIVGYSPMGVSVSIQTKGKTDMTGGWRVIEIDETMHLESMTAVACMREYVWHLAYINYENQHEITPDAQEGAQENEFFLVYKDNKGQEEAVTARINPINHELTFKTKATGEVRVRLNDHGLLLLDNKGATVADFSMKPPQ